MSLQVEDSTHDGLLLAEIPVRWRPLVRWLLLAFALGGLVLLIGAIPARLNQLSAVCEAAVCPALILVPADFAVWQQWGWSVYAYAVYHTAVELILILPVAILWLIIFRRYAHSWIGCLTCLALVYLGVGLGNILWAWTQVSEVAAFFGDIINEIGATALISLFFLFPDGRLAPRWTRHFLAFLLAVILPLGVINFILSPGSDGNLPDTLNAFAFLFYILLGAAVQVIRYRRTATQPQRQQTKWVVIGFVSFMTSVLLWFLFMEIFPLPPGQPRLLGNLLLTPLLFLLSATFPASLGLAILHYRLWDIDIFLNRTLVYGGMSGIIIGLYTLIVGGFSTVFQTQANFVTTLFATGLIAVIFQPARERLQRAANRLMFGERDDPYAVLSKLGQRLQATAVPQQILPAITATITQTLKMPYAAIILQTSAGARQTVAASGPWQPILHEWPLHYQGEPIGWLVVAPRSPSEAFTDQEQRLLADIAAQSGAAAYSVRLTNALQSAREKLVLAREEERRRIRRDLHDELGPTLASQTFTLDAALDLLGHDPPKAAHLLHQIKSQNQGLVADIRQLVHALRPPALDELGLVGALETMITRLENENGPTITLTVSNGGLHALPAAVEVAAYRIALEGINNVMRHAQAHHCTVTLAQENGRLSLTIADDGRGLPLEANHGVGLTSMQERVEELGGRLTVAATHPSGTRIMAVLPSGDPF